MEQHKMTATDAQTFERHSLAHAAILAQAAEAKGCTCQAYQDWFTYNRWQALGFQVQKGEHGIKLTTWIEYDDETSNGTTTHHSRPNGTTVFCRCQVKPKGACE